MADGAAASPANRDRPKPPPPDNGLHQIGEDRIGDKPAGFGEGKASVRTAGESGAEERLADSPARCPKVHAEAGTEVLSLIHI